MNGLLLIVIGISMGERRRGLFGLFGVVFEVNALILASLMSFSNYSSQ